MKNTDFISFTPVMNGILLAERDFPEEERYDGYIQLENGVGMMRLFIDRVR